MSQHHCRSLANSPGRPGRTAVLLPALLAVLVLPAAVRADVRLPKVISDHMVVQRDAAVPVWGSADAGEAVTVSIAGQTKTVEPAANGKWMVTFEKLPAGPHTLTVKGKNTITVNDVHVGEVWLASG